MKLFTPLTVRGLTLKNRIVVSPMCQYSSEDGFANDWHLVHLGTRAVGGAALVFTEATAVEARGRISPQDLGLWKDEHIAELTRIVQFLHTQGAYAGIQLAHAGRKASKSRPWKGDHLLSTEQGGWRPIVAPSAIPFDADYAEPVALQDSEIKAMTQAFVDATHRALRAGFDVIEIHAAHGYLFHEFLSPLSNQRTDGYGGSFENRTRFLRETATAVRAILPDTMPLFVRISATDWTEGGWTPEDSVQLATQLKSLGVDVMDCSSGGNVADAKIPTEAGYQVPFADKIRREADMLTAAVGLITTPEQAEKILADGQADLILLAREFLRTPYWPMEAASELGVDLPWADQYGRAKRRPKAHA